MKIGSILAVTVTIALWCSSAVLGDVVTFTSPSGVLSTGWNQFTLPGIALDPSPISVLHAYDRYADGSGLDARFSRWDSVHQGTLTWDAWSDKAIAQFGGMVSSDGYRIKLGANEPKQFSFVGLNDTDNMDVYISLPKAGKTLIGDPFSYSVRWSDILVTDGDQTLSMEAACRQSKWLQSMASGFNSTRQGTFLVGLPDDYPDTEYIRPWNSYWVKSFKDNIALIVPSGAH